MSAGDKTRIERDMERRFGRELTQAEINAGIIARITVPAGRGWKKIKRAIRAAIYEAAGISN